MLSLSTVIVWFFHVCHGPLLVSTHRQRRCRHILYGTPGRSLRRHKSNQAIAVSMFLTACRVNNAYTMSFRHKFGDNVIEHSALLTLLFSTCTQHSAQWKTTTVFIAVTYYGEKYEWTDGYIGIIGYRKTARLSGGSRIWRGKVRPFPSSSFSSPPLSFLPPPLR